MIDLDSFLFPILLALIEPAGEKQLGVREYRPAEAVRYALHDLAVVDALYFHLLARLAFLFVRRLFYAVINHPANSIQGIFDIA